MNILICDDIPDESAELAALINDSELKLNTVVLHNGDDALRHVRSGAAVDACFLDIIMPEMSGVEVAEKLREHSFKGEIIFLTSSNEYAAESYKVKAFSYLLKPPVPADVRNILYNLEEARVNNDTSGVIVKVMGKSRFISFHDLSYVEVVQHKVYFKFFDGSEIDSYVTFGEIAASLLVDKRFVQCHRSYIVNLNDVSYTQGNDFIMRRGARVPISKGFSEVKKHYLGWVLGEGEK